VDVYLQEFLVSDASIEDLFDENFLIRVFELSQMVI